MPILIPIWNGIPIMGWITIPRDPPCTWTKSHVDMLCLMFISRKFSILLRPIFMCHTIRWMYTAQVFNCRKPAGHREVAPREFDVHSRWKPAREQTRKEGEGEEAEEE